MNQSLLNKLQALVTRHEEIATALSQPAVINDQDKFRTLSKEYAELEDVVACYKTYQGVQGDCDAAAAMIEQETDPDMRAMAEEELNEAKAKLPELSQQLQTLLLPRDPNDARNIYLEVRAGTGGDEAAIFAGDLYRMYSRYAELMGWRCELINANGGEHGGYKEVIVKISGQDVYSRLKFESGAHRVQRVPVTESQGRVHTSACTVAVLPEVESIDEIAINPADLKVDTFRASGAGGQHVNKTDSAIRITHLPSGVVVECQDERSQHKNRAKALALLQAKLLATAQQEQRAEQAAERRSLVGSGDRSERIRTYNYPQGRVSDHRINLTLYKLEEIMEGQLAQVIEPLMVEHQAELMAQFADEKGGS